MIRRKQMMYNYTILFGNNKNVLDLCMYGFYLPLHKFVVSQIFSNDMWVFKIKVCRIYFIFMVE